MRVRESDVVVVDDDDVTEYRNVTSFYVREFAKVT